MTYLGSLLGQRCDLILGSSREGFTSKITVVIVSIQFLVGFQTEDFGFLLVVSQNLPLIICQISLLIMVTYFLKCSKEEYLLARWGGRVRGPKGIYTLI